MADNEKKPLILVVDDISQNLKILGHILSDAGYEMAFAQNGKQALNILDTVSPDLMLLDIMMPEVDGYEVCKKVNSNEAKKDIPIIFLTAKSDTADVAKGFSLGAVDYISKPFNKQELLARIKTHLELKFSREKLKNALASKNKFFSIIAHDLRHPIDAILSFAFMMNKYAAEMTKEELEKITTELVAMTNNTSDLLENLLMWSKSQTNSLDFDPIKFSLTEVLEKISELLSGALTKKKINFTFSVSEDLEVYGDLNMIETVIRNLITNAVKFTEEGGEILVKGEELRKSVRITVEDNGIGMSEEDIEKLFRNDIKFSNPGTNKEKGSGLGLMLCKEFIEKHKGTINVHSELGKGSSFIINLPKGGD